MAEVFAARLSGEAGFAKLVAVKRMLAHLAADEALVARFHDEARLAAYITSPYVVQTLDVGRSEDGQPFIVLELVLGVSLAHLLEQRPLPSLPVRLELVTQAALGLADVHEACAPDGTPLGIVHRDVSPHNILVGSDGRARLADFGIARANVPRQETRTGVVLGKWGYMAPEQARCGPLDARTDVYAMGAVAWEALAGRRLHHAAAEQVTRRVVSGALPSPREAAPEIPEPIARVIERAMAHDPDARYANGRELAEALESAARELGPPVPRKTLVDEVRRAAGRSLADLERVLAELAAEDGRERTVTLGPDGATVSGLISEWDPDAATVSLSTDDRTEPAGATSDGAVALPSAPPDGRTGFTPTDPTRVDPRPRTGRPTRTSSRTQLAVVVAMGVALGAALAVALGSGDDSPPAEAQAPVALPTAPTERAVASPAPPEAPTGNFAADLAEPRGASAEPGGAAPIAEPEVVARPEHDVGSSGGPARDVATRARPRRAAPRRARRPEPERRTGPFLGVDHFDRAQ